MAISGEELSRRLKIARENAGMTQEEVASEIGVSRGLIGQIEAGIKAPNSLQLAKLAALYGREAGDFLRVDFNVDQRDALAALFRADTQIAEDPIRSAAVRESVNLCREYANLEALLGFERERVYPVTYDVGPPKNRWEAIRQGEYIAELERGRLKLGDGAIQDLAAVLEVQGLRLLDAPLPDSVSGIFLADKRYGLSIIVNSEHHPRRQFFSYAHEFCHVLADRDRTAMVSRAENREDLSEVRANAFAAAFLVPETGLRAFIRALGKGEASRSVLQAFDEVAAVEGQKRTEAFSQELGFYDVVHAADHFGVSYESVLYRLLNLKLISEEERKRLADQKDVANIIRGQVEARREARTTRPAFAHQLLMLAFEAFRRKIISKGKLKELCLLVKLPQRQIPDLINAIADETEGKPTGEGVGES